MPVRSFSLNVWVVGTMILAMITIMAMDVVDLNIAVTVAAWVLPDSSSSRCANYANMNSANRPIQPCVPDHRWPLRMAEEEVAEETAPSSSMAFLETDEWEIIEALHKKASTKASDIEGEEAFQSAAEELLPALSPTLIMKLRTGEDLVPTDARDNKGNDRLLKIFSEVSKALNTMTDRRLESARDTLAELMNAGEIKKLDAVIGKNARNQKLDVAFFQVLQMNMRDAAEEAQRATSTGEEETSSAVDRFQILQHIYTRCQEEVEKVINPGTALLNKLLRTEVDSIRRNQLNHYLCPKPTTITSPDGKEIVLNNGQPSKPLVSHPDFFEAIGNAIMQIRTVEKSGATTPEVAADLVETIRTVAIEARFTIGEHFGGNSTEVIAFEEALEPVFRPTSPDSIYIQGQQVVSEQE
uniref:Uncharacterized protein n=1 Tax=Pseudo-nitzschia delicatissima TaxID=44447 RepID=A0A7S0UM71_9STRA|mmetsp:Transcript_3993/g.8317  ORF Transcript_3993/g.8317 Transcript_3993/m.8317 type:complete len:412 (+) Transcript_3993:74-1309(+)